MQITLEYYLAGLNYLVLVYLIQDVLLKKKTRSAMWFINPMWDNEAERIGKLTCTPLGYRLHVISDLIGFLGLLSFVAGAGFLIFRGIAGTFNSSLLWVFALPVVLGLIGSALFDFSWRLARRRGFEYDTESRTAAWLEDGQRQTFNYARDKDKTHAEQDGTSNGG